MLRRLCAVTLLSAAVAQAQAPRSISVLPDAAHWDLQGQAKPVTYKGKKCLLLDGGAAVVKDFTMRDAIIDVDVAAPAARGFLGSSSGWLTRGPMPSSSTSASTPPGRPTPCSTPRSSTPA